MRPPFCAWWSNLQDTLSWFRALKLIDHIGDATVYQILDHPAVERKKFRSASTKDNLFKKLHRFPARASYKAQLIRLARVLTTVLESKSPCEQLTAVLRLYRPLLKARYDDSHHRGPDLEHLQAIAKRYKTAAKLLDDEVYRRLCYFVNSAFGEGPRVGQPVCDLDDSRLAPVNPLP